MTKESTRSKILDSAETLFSTRGFSATSVRAITQDAGVNLASLNYYFGSKEALIDAVFERRLGPLNQERIRCLEVALSESESAAETRPSLETVLEAFLAPALRLARDPAHGGEGFMRLMGRAHSESNDFFRSRIASHFTEVLGRFHHALHLSVPDLSKDELNCRIQFTIGAMAYTMVRVASTPSSSASRLQEEPVEGAPSRQVNEVQASQLCDADAFLERLIQFSAAGFRSKSQAPEKAGTV